MDAVLLDTDVFSYLLKGSSHGEPYKKHVRNKTVAVSFVTVGELYSWAEKRGWGEKKRAELDARLRSVVVVPFDMEICRRYAELTNLPGGQTIAANDRWIAACAIRHGIPLVTNNRRHFEGIPGLQLITEAPASPNPQDQPLPLVPPPAGEPA